ncbi:aldehyde dehydrogenase PutA [Penicillium brasilianum]|uniref:Aldehyde dehydrogenase PutA n=1 Tax=Penicillium brasilianum TaxID=104259 RepID=A0A1S9RMU3_PENBI|nr:aldehyde dehydrogenase PutA [Penicillium brasilianum]
MDLTRIVAANLDGRTQNTRYRQAEFHRLQAVLVKHIAEIQDAIRADSGHTQQEIRAEVVLALQELRTHYTSLDLKKDLEIEYRIANGKDNAENVQGAGIVYIVPSTHTLFFSVISALTAALAAGNCIVLELPQTTMALPALLRQILPDALDHDTFAITSQRPDKSFLDKALLVVQTGADGSHGLISPADSRSVAIVDRTARVAEAAQSLVAARFALGGRSPYSPDVVLVNEFAMKPFVEAVIQHASKYLAGENGEARQVSTSPRRPGVLDSIHKDRTARVLVSGSNWGVVEVQDRNSPLLKKKIDEKVLLVHPVTSLDDAIDVSFNENLAAVYAFAAPASAKYLTQFIDADISWVNHVPSHMLIGPALPRNTPYSPQTRYATSQFQKPRTQLIIPSATANATQIILGNENTVRSDALWREALAPLPSTKQRPGFKIGFFEQGIITGVSLTLISLVATVSTLGYYTWTFVKLRS